MTSHAIIEVKVRLTVTWHDLIIHMLHYGERTPHICLHNAILRNMGTFNMLITWHVCVDMSIRSWHWTIYQGLPRNGNELFSLTHFALDKMAAFSATIFVGASSFMKRLVFWLKFLWSLFPRSNKPALVQIMTWRRLGYKPLSEPMLTRFTEVNMWH